MGDRRTSGYDNCGRAAEVDFVSEVSSNHQRDMGRSLAFVDQSAKIGCTAVKCQLFRIRELFAPEVLRRRHELRLREGWELPVEFLPVLADRCHEVGLRFACAPFYLDAVDELFPYIDFYKIASYELLWDDLLTACAGTGKPVVLSTGMATLAEIDGAVGALRKAGCEDLTLLHTVSGYPTPLVQCNLAAIDTMRRTFGCLVGWSDHTVNPAVIHRAVHRWGASMVEFHLDLDGEGAEFATGHCWLPEQIGPVIGAVRAGPEADGTGEKVPSQSELADREWRAAPEDGLRPLVGIRPRVGDR